MIPAVGTPLLSEVLDDMLGLLRDRLPAAPAEVPPPAVSLVRLVERPVGLGHWRGNEGRGSSPLVALKGGRLEAVVRFELWAASPVDVDAALLDLQQGLLDDREALRALGFLHLQSTDSPPAEPIADPEAWRRGALYRVLYEYRYAETDGADSLIARIPIRADDETTQVTDWMVRWDGEQAPDLVVRLRGRSSATVRAVHGVAFLPAGFDGAAVTLESFAGGVARQQVFATVRELVDDLETDGDPVELGGNSYTTGVLTLAEPVTLRRGDEFFRLTYSEDNFDNDGSEAVLYLRALR